MDAAPGAAMVNLTLIRTAIREEVVIMAALPLSIVREPIIFPHELATLKDILLITPEGFCRVEKVPYYSDTWRHPKPDF